MLNWCMVIMSDSLLARSHIHSNLEDDVDKQGNTESLSNSSKVKVAFQILWCTIFPSWITWLVEKDSSKWERPSWWIIDLFSIFFSSFDLNVNKMAVIFFSCRILNHCLHGVNAFSVYQQVLHWYTSQVILARLVEMLCKVRVVHLRKKKQYVGIAGAVVL